MESDYEYSTGLPDENMKPGRASLIRMRLSPLRRLRGLAALVSRQTPFLEFRDGWTLHHALPAIPGVKTAFRARVPCEYPVAQPAPPD